MTPQEIQALAQGIVGTFINSIPNIVTQVNQQNKNNRASSGNRYNTDPLDNDLNRETLRRIKREQDVTHSLVNLLQARHKELKNLTTFNEGMIKLIRQQGTYDNQTNQMSNDLRKSIKSASQDFSTFFSNMNGVSDRAKKLNATLSSALNQFKLDEQSGRVDKMSDVLGVVATSVRKEIEKIKTELAADKGMSTAQRAMFTTLINDVSAKAYGLQLQQHYGIVGTENDIKIIMNPLADLVDQMTIRNDSFKDHLKNIAINNVNMSTIAQKLEHVEDFYSNFGDKFSEPAELQNMYDSIAKLRVDQARFNKENIHDQAAIKEYADQVSASINQLTPTINKLVKEVDKNSRNLKWNELFSNLKSGKFSNAKDNAGEIEDKLPKWAKLLLKGVKVAAKAIPNIADDQLNVQKYGVQMMPGIDSFLTNYQDATRAGLTPAQMAEWKQQNRSVGGALGGERTATEQFKHMMGAITDTNATKLMMNGQTQTFSELIGGDSQYKKDTYDSIVQSLAKNGILPNSANVVGNLTKNGGIYKTAYQLGLLPKELTDFHTSLTESAAFNVTAIDNNSDVVLAGVNQFQLLGQKLGLSTAATQNLTKQLYDDSHRKGTDLIKSGIVAKVVAQQMGFGDADTAKIGKFFSMQGNQREDFLAKNQDFAKGPLAKFITEQERSAMGEYDGNKLNAHYMAINKIAEVSPDFLSMITQVKPLINQNLARGQGVDVKNVNNKELNSTMSIVAQEWRNVFDPANATTLGKIIYGTNAAVFGLEAASDGLTVAFDSLTNSVTTLFTKMDEKQTNIGSAVGSIRASEQLALQSLQQKIWEGKATTVDTAPEKLNAIGKSIEMTYSSFAEQNKQKRQELQDMLQNAKTPEEKTLLISAINSLSMDQSRMLNVSNMELSEIRRLLTIQVNQPKPTGNNLPTKPKPKN